MMISDFFVGAALTAAGIGVVGLMTYPMVTPRSDRPRDAAVLAAKVISDRWPRPIEKADRSMAPKLTDVRPLGPTVALQLQPESGNKPLPLPVIEQAIERKAVDEGAERATKEYHRAAARRGLDEPRDVCARHGMHRHYFHRRHRLSWRCMGHGR